MTGLEIYAIIWLTIQIISIGFILPTYRAGNMKIEQVIGNIIGVIISIPIYICGFLYIFK